MSEDLQVINLSIVEEAKELMGDRFPTMVKYFLEDTEMYLSEIEKGLAHKDANMVLSPAHTIKSSAKQLGAEHVSDAARQLELHCREIMDGTSEDYDHMERLYNELREQAEEVTPHLEKYAE